MANSGKSSIQLMGLILNWQFFNLIKQSLRHPFLFSLNPIIPGHNKLKSFKISSIIIFTFLHLYNAHQIKFNQEIFKSSKIYNLPCHKTPPQYISPHSSNSKSPAKTSPPSMKTFSTNSGSSSTNAIMSTSNSFLTQGQQNHHLRRFLLPHQSYRTVQ
jgi:hypothetical protein